MMRRMVALSCLFSLCVGAACAAETAPAAIPAPAIDLSSEEAKTLYALGLAISARVGDFRLTPGELETVQAGLADGVLGQDPKVDMAVYGPKIQEFYQQRMAAAASDEKKLGQEYLEQMAKEPGAVTTESGMVFIETAAGTGASPQPTDKVKLHYHGTLRDGKVFDSSVLKGEPVVFPLNGVIPCFGEGVARMKTGGKAKIVCPSSIAYGEMGSPPSIMPGATLTFEIELIEIVNEKGE